MFDMSELGGHLAAIHLEADTDADYTSPSEGRRPGTAGSTSSANSLAGSTKAVHASMNSVEMTLKTAQEYTYENGRRYPAVAGRKYILPIDQAELERLDLTHQLWMMLLNDKCHLAPLQNPQRVLDLGTGNATTAPLFA